MEQSLPKMGTDIKMNINLTLPDGLTMAAVNFTAKFTANSSNGQLILKDAMHKVDDNNYIALIDTSIVGKGRYYCTITVQIPEILTDLFPDGYRTEIFTINTDLTVV